MAGHHDAHSGGEEFGAPSASCPSHAPTPLPHGPSTHEQRWGSVPISEPGHLADAWQWVAPRLLNAMGRWGADEDTARDAAQEAAARALARLVDGSHFDSRRGLLLWCLRVARHHLTDEWRMRERHADPGPVPERALPDDTATAVEWRLALEETAKAITGMTANERAALIATLTPAPVIDDKRARDREGLRRLRARQRLRSMTRGLPVALPWQRFRWWERCDWAAASTGVAVVTTVLLGVIVAAGLSSGTENYVSPPDDGIGGIAPVAVVSLASATRTPASSGLSPHSNETVARRAPEAKQSPPTSASVRVTVPTPNGSQFEAGTRPNEPDKPFICAETWLTPLVCVPKPLPRRS